MTNEVKELTFYKQPFASSYSWVRDDGGRFCFQFEPQYDEKGSRTKEYKVLEGAIMQSLNDNDLKPVDGISLTYLGVDIFNHGTHIITIRGWGALTGHPNKFSEEKAAKIQDDFRDWIIYKLTGIAVKAE